MPLELQAKLLRLLQERTFRRVGGTKDITCTATIIASSNRNLKKEIQEKRFRQDLYYRLNVCPITMPPLRAPDRREDIARLAAHFLKTSTICPATPGRTMSITKLALEALQKHDWPGNVRELRNVIDRAILLETTDKIGLSSIAIDPPDAEEHVGGLHHPRGKDFSLEKAERELIAHALHETGWQKTQAAALLGITRATLYAKVKQYNIQRQTPHQLRENAVAAPASTPNVVTVG
jgi:DNA-binding NtrC family response regulator